MHQGFFLLFATVSVVTALTLVLARNPVHSALALMACFLQISAIFVMLGAPLLAVIQIFVYVGAIMVLFLFVIMMVDVAKRCCSASCRAATCRRSRCSSCSVPRWSCWCSGAIASPQRRPLPSAARCDQGSQQDALLRLSPAVRSRLGHPARALVGAIVLARKEPG